MSFTASEFVSALTSEVPEATTTLSEHFAEQEGKLLLHLLAGDLRLGSPGSQSGGPTLVDASSQSWSGGLRDGDEYVENAVVVSFVEDLVWWEPEVHPFIKVLPAALLAEVETLRSRSE